MRVLSLFLAFTLFATVRATAALLPDTVALQPPFPRVVRFTGDVQPVAPGVVLGVYDAEAADGPLSVHVLAIDLHEPTVRLDTALASDRLISHGETLSSMARRANAVAAINGDYFDIGNTNQPLNILIRSGRLLRMPMQRYAFAIDRQRRTQFSEFRFAAQIRAADTSAEVNALNDWPQAGVTLLTPEFGTIAPSQNATLVRIEALSAQAPFGTFRVGDVVDATDTLAPSYYLGLGANAPGDFGIPAPGSTLEVLPHFTPPIDDLEAAIGGGPLLVRDGMPYDDPDGPHAGEFRTHMPVSGIGTRADGTVLLFEVDGREPDRSVGVTQPEFTALMRAFGVRDGMAFDAGGSATIVARVPGDAQPTVQNVPSDGQERRIADALLVYSTAPYGPPAQLVATPPRIDALPGATATLRVATLDAGEHPATTAAPLRFEVRPGWLGSISDGAFHAERSGDGAIVAHRGALRVAIPLRVLPSPTRLELLPSHANVADGGNLQFDARAFASDGRPIALPQTLPWTARDGAIDAHGRFVARDSDADVLLSLGNTHAEARVTVGQHEEELQFGSVTFASVPRDGPGALARPGDCPVCVALSYDFTTTERAAYADVDIPLPIALGLALDVDGDGNGEFLRVALDNAIRERVLLTAARVTWTGWRRVEVRFPSSLAQPARLRALYALSALGDERVTAKGTLRFRNLRVIAAGSARRRPQ